MSAGLLRRARQRHRELLLELRPRSPEAYGPLRELALVFERSWYGHRMPDAAEYAAARERYERVVGVVRDATAGSDAT